MNFFFIFIFIGIFSLTAQIVIVKEFINVFLGNELLLGFALCFWLLFNALGNFLVSYIKREEIQQYLFLVNLFLVTLIFPLTLFLIKMLYNAVAVTGGALISFESVLMVSVLIFAPIGILLGSLFTLGCGLIYRAEKVDNFIGIGILYFLEGLGALIGGILFNFCLVKIYSHFKITLILAWINIILLFLFLGKYSRAKVLSRLVLLTIILCSPWIMKWGQLEIAYNNLNFREEKVVLSSNSIYGNLSITQNEEQFNFYENGVFIDSSLQPEVKEEIAHLALLSHPDPQKVLLIGGGFSGLLKEILKHPVAKISYLELDPQIVKCVSAYINKESKMALEDKRVNIEYLDGRLFIKKSEEKFNLILTNLPGPVNGFFNRFYTKEFFLEVKQKLSPEGILAFSFPGAGNYMTEELSMLYASVWKTVKEVFLYVKLIPGEKTLFIASEDPRLNDLKALILIKRFFERKIATVWVNEKFINYTLSQEKINPIVQAIAAVQDKVKKNYDFVPVAYFYSLLHWEKLFSKLKIHYFSSLTAFTFPFWLVVVVSLGLLFFPKIKDKKRESKLLLYALFVVGFSTIVLEMLSIYVFQAIYGYAYHKIGTIFTFFMLGIAIGAAQSNRWILNEKLTALQIYVRINGLHFVLTAYALFFPLIFFLLSQFNK